METILAVNVGSSSKKYALFGMDGARLLRAHFEKTEDGYAASRDGGAPEPIEAAAYEDALAQVIRYAREQRDCSLRAIGLRVVAVGRAFSRHTRIDDAYRTLLARAASDDPDHTPLLLAELASLDRLLPGIPIVAASDSAFHKTMPETARRYALPDAVAEEFGIERVGYHGLSVASAARTLAALPEGMPARAVICHLGSGVSITALRDGASIETSMGFSPLSGVPMSTRVGDLDPEAVLRIAEERGVAKTRALLYGESGLRALSKRSGDMRDLLAAEKLDDRNARAAIDQFAYQVRLRIGAYAAALGGIDALAFTGTMGIRAAAVRARILVELPHLGIELDAGKNENAQPGDDIATAGSAVRIFILQTDEEEEIANAVKTILA